MLVLTREIGHSIQIDDDIVVRVLSYDRGLVRLGFVAPGHKILRSEIVRALRRRPVPLDLQRLADDGCPHAEGVS